MDFHSRGAQLKRMLSGDAQAMMASLLQSLSVALGVQKDGTVASDAHRVLNFQGAGVTVSDDGLSRRTNIYIPGAPASSSATTIVSTAGTEKVFTLGSEPANWFTTGFNDSTWTASVLLLDSNSAFFNVVSGTQWVSDQAHNVLTPAGCLVRRTFTLPSGTIQSATLEINVDDSLGSDNGLYLNGTSLAGSFVRSGSPINPATITVPIGLLVAGGSNVLAVHVNDVNSGTFSVHAVSYKLTATYATSGTDSQYELVAHKDQPNGYPSLDSGGKVPLSELPTVAGGLTVKELDGTPNVAGVTVLQLPNGTLTDNGGGNVTYTPTGASTPVSNKLSSNVAITTAGTFYDGPSVTIGAGTWLLVGSVDIQNNNTAIGVLEAKLWDGTTVYASGEQTPGANGGSGSIPVMAIVTPTGSTTYKISATSQRTSCQIVAATPSTNQGNNASYLNAFPLG